MSSVPDRSPERHTQPKSHHLTVRVPDLLYARLDYAAELTEMSQSELIRAAIREKLDAVLTAHRVEILSDRDMDALLESIANPPEPNEAMLRAMAGWRAHVRHDYSTP